MSDISEVFLKAAFDGLQEAVCVVDAHTHRILFANACAGRLAGQLPGDLTGIPIEHLTATPEDQIFWGQEATLVAQGIHSMSSLRHMNGTLVPIERRVSPCTLHAPGDALLVTMLDRSAQQDSERQLESMVSQLQATLDSAADGMMVCGLDGSIRAFNQRLAQIWQMPQSLLVQGNDAAVHTFMGTCVLDPAGYGAQLHAMAPTPELCNMHTIALRGGHVLERRSSPQMHRGSVIGRMYVFRDITQQIETQAELRVAAQAFVSSLDAIFITDSEHRLLRLNPAAEALWGGSAQQLLGTDMVTLWSDEAGGISASSLRATLERDGLWRSETQLRRAGGNCPVHLSWVLVRDDQGNVVQGIGFLRDLTEQRAAQKRINELAYSDALTGLPNRLLLSQRVDSAICAALPSVARFAVLFLDLDRFKIINDSLGHAFGDRVLQLVSARLQSCLRTEDMLCRLGGDEFVVYLHGGNADVAEMVARRMLYEMRRPFTLDGIGFSIQCSMGVAMCPQDGNTLDALIKQADTAMYRVKEQGRGNYGFYQPQMNANLLSRMQLEHAMRQALEHGRMAVHYQPQLDLSTGQIVGAEALLRWTDPKLGSVSPGVFIPLAEETGYIVTLGAWVLDQAVQQAACWMKAGQALVVSVNVSALEFRQPDFVDRLSSLLAAYGLRPEFLELELTESILQNAHEAARRLAEVSALGVAMAIDDFGTGYSSLAYLKSLPIRKLKIDQSFVRGLPSDAGDKAIVSAIVQMGHALRMEVVAEGVETEGQRMLLQQLHCNHYQGFLCSPALAPNAFDALRHTHAAALPILPLGDSVSGHAA